MLESDFNINCYEGFKCTQYPRLSSSGGYSMKKLHISVVFFTILKVQCVFLM